MAERGAVAAAAPILPTTHPLQTLTGATMAIPAKAHLSAAGDLSAAAADALLAAADDAAKAAGTLAEAAAEARPSYAALSFFSAASSRRLSPSAMRGGDQHESAELGNLIPIVFVKIIYLSSTGRVCFAPFFSGGGVCSFLPCIFFTLPTDYLKEPDVIRKAKQHQIFADDGELSEIRYVFLPRSGATMETYVAEVPKLSNGKMAERQAILLSPTPPRSPRQLKMPPADHLKEPDVVQKAKEH